jgi:hypothetical protein
MSFNPRTRGLDTDKTRTRYVGGVRVTEAKRLPGNRTAEFRLPVQILPRDQDPFSQRRVPIINRKALLSIKERLKNRSLFKHTF